MTIAKIFVQSREQRNIVKVLAREQVNNANTWAQKRKISTHAYNKDIMAEWSKALD